MYFDFKWYTLRSHINIIHSITSLYIVCNAYDTNMKPTCMRNKQPNTMISIDTNFDRPITGMTGGEKTIQTVK